MAKAEKVLFTQPGVRLDLSLEEAKELHHILQHAKSKDMTRAMDDLQLGLNGKVYDT